MLLKRAMTFFLIKTGLQQVGSMPRLRRLYGGALRYVMIALSVSQYKEILEHAAKAVPNEACGLLGGRFDGEGRIVEKVYLLENIDHSPEHFSMRPEDQFRAVSDMRKNGWSLLGNFHSHPESPSRPSDEDKRLAFDPNLSYFILSLMDKEYPVLKSFRITKDAAVEEPHLIREEVR